MTNGNTDYAGMIIARQEKEVLNQFLTYLFEQKDWDLFLLPNLPQESQTLKLLRAAEIIYFSLEEPFTTTLFEIAIVIIAILFLGVLAYYLKKRKG